MKTKQKKRLSPQPPIQLLIISLLIGIGNELFAHLSGVWLYRQWFFSVSNCLLMFGFVMPLIAYQLCQRPLWQLYMTGAFIGLIYEGIDQSFLHWAYFSEPIFLGFSDERFARFFIGFLWGWVPVAIITISRGLNSLRLKQKMKVTL